MERQANEHVNGQNKIQAEVSALKKDHDVAKDKVARYVKFYHQYHLFEYHIYLTVVPHLGGHPAFRPKVWCDSSHTHCICIAVTSFRQKY